MSGSADASARVRRVEAAYRNRNAKPVVETLRALEPAEVLARSGSGGANVFEQSAQDEKGIFTGLEEARSEGSPRKLYRKGYRTLQWKATRPRRRRPRLRARVAPGGGREVDSAAEGPARDVLLVRRDVASGRRVRVPRDGLRRRVQPGRREDRVARVGPRADRQHAARRSARSARSAGSLEFEAVDAASPILEAEYSVDAKKWIRIEPKDGLVRFAAGVLRDPARPPRPAAPTCSCASPTPRATSRVASFVAP